MIPATTPPAIDLSRSRLKGLTTWIRNELDPIVAREGPDVLRPDDVLTLHETFVSLRQSTRITALDLRATGMHRAIQDIAGVATRWPSRLCDDCDKIIGLWTARFGPFNKLHPFLYGRGGRLEGIASVADYTREALLKHWAEVCPERIHPKRSHRLGDLGFKAGDWWINTLFAHHAGIIGLESEEGGTTFDEHGAYALLLKDTGEVEAASEERFSYRVPHSDKGKYRLTAATPASRDPIRILRSHSINSIWGPKAGVRYEGLYRVTGWSIRTAKPKDTTSGEFKEGEIMFEVRVERIDHIPMEEVTKRPTATEVDDYSEYKRMRKLYREEKRKVQISAAEIMSSLQVSKIAPPIAPTVPPEVSPGPSRASIFRRPHFDLPPLQHQGSFDVVSPGTVPDSGDFLLVKAKHVKFSSRTDTISSKLAQGDEGHSPDQKGFLAPTPKDTGSVRSDISDQPQIREVAPWVDFELEAAAPPGEFHNNTPLHLPKLKDPSAGTTSASVLRKDVLKKPATIQERKDDASRVGNSFRKHSGELRNLIPSSTSHSGKGKFSLVRTKTPVAKLFDGVVSDEEGDDYFGPLAQDMPTSPSTSQDMVDSPQVESSVATTVTGDTAQSLLTTLAHSLCPESPFTEGRRNALASIDMIAPAFPALLPTRVDQSSQSITDDESIIDSAAQRSSTTLPVSLLALMAKSELGPPEHDANAVVRISQMTEPGVAEPKYVQANREWLEGADIKVAFRNPFSESPVQNMDGARHKRGSIDCMAPDVVA